MNILNILAGPLIGAFIGYGTNYIAIKMLFKPLKPIKIGNVVLPFTPGIIPKRKEKLAYQFGIMVEKELLTYDALFEVLSSKEMKHKIIDEIINIIYNEKEENNKQETNSEPETNSEKETDSKQETNSVYSPIKEVIEVNKKNIINNTPNIKMILESHFSENYNNIRECFIDSSCNKIVASISSINIGEIITNEISNSLKEKVRGSIVGKLIHEGMIRSIAEPIGDKILEKIEKNGDSYIRPIIESEIQTVEESTIPSLLLQMNIDKTKFRAIVEHAYDKILQEKIKVWIEEFQIASIVEKKVNNMNILQIEQLVLSVMKHELNMVVNLGAIIGFFIGLLNLLF